jgi:UPF0716 family protein affecting phage T7 exclusion
VQLGVNMNIEPGRNPMKNIFTLVLIIAGILLLRPCFS